jgi:hypothetical protein
MARRRGNRRLERVIGIAIDLQCRIGGAEGGRAARDQPGGGAGSRGTTRVLHGVGVDREVLEELAARSACGEMVVGQGCWLLAGNHLAGVREDKRFGLEASN